MMEATCLSCFKSHVKCEVSLPVMAPAQRDPCGIFVSPLRCISTPPTQRSIPCKRCQRLSLRCVPNPRPRGRPKKSMAIPGSVTGNGGGGTSTMGGSAHARGAPLHPHLTFHANPPPHPMAMSTGTDCAYMDTHHQAASIMPLNPKRLDELGGSGSSATHSAAASVSSSSASVSSNSSVAGGSGGAGVSSTGSQAGGGGGGVAPCDPAVSALRQQLYMRMQLHSQQQPPSAALLASHDSSLSPPETAVAKGGKISSNSSVGSTRSTSSNDSSSVQTSTPSLNGATADTASTAGTPGRPRPAARQVSNGPSTRNGTAAITAAGESSDAVAEGMAVVNPADTPLNMLGPFVNMLSGGEVAVERTRHLLTSWHLWTLEMETLGPKGEALPEIGPEKERPAEDLKKVASLVGLTLPTSVTGWAEDRGDVVVGSSVEEDEQVQSFLDMCVDDDGSAICSAVYSGGRLQLTLNSRFAAMYMTLEELETTVARDRLRPELVWRRLLSPECSSAYDEALCQAYFKGQNLGGEACEIIKCVDRFGLEMPCFMRLRIFASSKGAITASVIFLLPLQLSRLVENA